MIFPIQYDKLKNPSNDDKVMIGNDDTIKDCDLNILLAKVEDQYLEDYVGIGIPGTAGFGVGYCQEELPTGFTALFGVKDVYSDNYGNYQYLDGSIMVYIPAFYYRINHEDNSTYAEYDVNSIDIKGINDFATEESANEFGYVFHRAFIDGGEKKKGVFVDKYMCSNNSGTPSSIKNGYPISIHADHNPISDLTGITVNQYYSAVDASKIRGDDFFCNTRFIQSALALISLAHGQASSSTTYCGWYDSTYNYPKGNNDNALGDIDDTSLTFTSDGYSNCALTGSGVPFNKTTHNGQNCGISDVNGNMWEINLGITRDSGNTNFYVLKESIEAKSLTSGTGTLSTDTWGDSAHLSSLYDIIDIPYVTGNDGWTNIGSSNQVLSSSISGDGYNLTSLGFPESSDGLGGTDLFGNDGIYRYLRSYLTLLSSGSWLHGSHAGVFAAYLNPSRSYSYNNVGFRFACYTN